MLVAGTADAIGLVTELIAAEADIVVARSVDAARRELDLPLDAIVCSVRFDESRMFDFLQTLRGSPPSSALRVICLRASPPPLPAALRSVIESALEALAIRTFIDFPALAEEVGDEEARLRLRASILG